MTNLTCNVTTPEFTNRHENVKKVRIELKSGIAEVFPNHQDLLGTIGIGIIQIDAARSFKPDIFHQPQVMLRNSPT